jgi:hypothetical protein
MKIDLSGKTTPITEERKIEQKAKRPLDDVNIKTKLEIHCNLICLSNRIP